jgi:hypothetical protein
MIKHLSTATKYVLKNYLVDRYMSVCLVFPKDIRREMCNTMEEESQEGQQLKQIKPYYLHLLPTNSRKYHPRIIYPWLFLIDLRPFISFFRGVLFTRELVFGLWHYFSKAPLDYWLK